MWLTLLAATPVWAQYQSKQPLSPDTILMGRIQVVVSEILAHQPNFTCVETIERSQRTPNSKKYKLVDNVRLEVALVEGKELYAWPGAKKFEERDLRDMVAGGAIGTGDFALHAKSIYLSGTAKFTYRGTEEMGGRKTHKFHYRVPLADSRYIMRIGTTEGPVGYQGDVWNDAGTLEMVRIEMTIDEIPSYLPLKEGHKIIEYGRVPIGGTDYVLPTVMEMTLAGLNDGESRNRAVFTSCRQYSGESTLIFDEPAPDAVEKAEQVEVTLPSGLNVPLKLVKTLELSKAAMGDPVVFEVTKNVERGGQVLLPKGARVELRLDAVVCRDFPTGHCFVALAPGRFSFENKGGVFRASLIAPDLQRSMELLLRAMRPEMRMLPPELGQASPGSEFLLISGGRGKLGSGYATSWRTLEARGETQ